MLLSSACHRRLKEYVMTAVASSSVRAVRLSRLRPPLAPSDPSDLVRLPLARHAWVYKRLSSHEQKKRSIWSFEQQDALRAQARADGYYDDQIVVEDRDLGISGTKGAEHRPGLAAMIAAIEAGGVESVYVVHVSRLTRNQTLIDGMQLGELFRRHNIVLCLPTMRLNLRDPMHMRLYRQEVERAADEIELLKLRLGGPKRHKALAGRWDGRGVPLGYLVDRTEGSPTFDRYLVYAPHAAVVRSIFRALIDERTPTLAARALRNAGVIIPDFPLDVPIGRGSIVRSTKPLRVPGGFAITPSLLRSIVTNPVYLGWWLVNGQVVREDNHPPIVDEATFWEAQECLSATATMPQASG